MNNLLRKKLSSRVLSTVLMFALFGGTLSPGIPYWVFLFPLLVVFLYVSISTPTLGLVFIAFAHSFSGFVRWKEQDATLLAGFGTILIVLFFVGLIARGLLGRPFRLPLEDSDWLASKIIFSVWLLFLALILLHVVATWKGGVATVMMFREYILPLMLLPIAVSLLSSRPKDCRVVLIALFLGCVSVALINIVHYVVDLPLNTPRWVTLFDGATGISTELPDIRIVFGTIPLPRMRHILGLSGAGAGGVYFITIALMGFVLARQTPIKKWRRLMYLGSLVVMIAAFLTLSFSPGVAFGFVSIYLYIASNKRKGIVRTSVAAVVMVFMLAVLLPGLGDSDSSTGGGEYIGKMWTQKVGPALAEFDKILLGDGLGLKSAGALGLADFNNDKYGLLTDQWLLVALYQLGVLGLILVIALFALPLLMTIRILGRRRGDEIGHLSIAAGTLVAGFVGFSHGAAPIERLYSLPMMLAIAVIIVAAKGLARGPSTRLEVTPSKLTLQQ